MIKVLQYVPSYNYGGIETFTYNLNTQLYKKCKFVYVVEYDISKNTLDNLKKLNADVIRIPNLKDEGLIKHISSIIKIFKRNKFDVVHVHDCNIRFLIMLISKIYRVKKRIYHIHSINIGGSKIKQMIKKIGLLINIKCSTNIFACSKEAAETKIKNNEFLVINNGIDVDSFAFNIKQRNQVRKSLNVSKECLVLLAIGRLVPVKNYDFLIDLLSVLVQKNENIHLLLVGDGELQEALVKKVELLKLNDHVTFLGKQIEINKYYSAADILCVPSINEGLSIVLIEAQSNGLPCIASTNVPKETNITGKVKYIPANSKQDINKWANYIESENINRYNKIDDIIKKGFDFKTSSKIVYDVYVK